MNVEQHYTVEQVAEMCGLDPDVPIQLVYGEHVPMPLFVGRAVRVPERHLPAWREALRAMQKRAAKLERPIIATSTVGRVYFIQAVGGEGPIKIGLSNDPEYRLGQIQLCSPVKLTILATVPGGEKRERQLHRRFGMWRLHGEWFAPNAPGLRSLIWGAEKRERARIRAFDEAAA